MVYSVDLHQLVATLCTMVHRVCTLMARPVKVPEVSVEKRLPLEHCRQDQLPSCGTLRSNLHLAFLNVNKTLNAD